ncbi:hypothetical protein B0X78_03725 [bacterium AM6]|nr:hypothetical protein B0X78_03725 [bacterium AM6]
MLTSLLFGVSMVSNGVFTTGSPLHGLYGIGIFSILTPLLFLAELGPAASTRMAWIARVTSLLGMAYLWLMLSGFDRSPIAASPSASRCCRRSAGTPSPRWS